MCRIISFVSSKGGLGKSVIIDMLAETLAKNNKRVCVVDGVFGLNFLQGLSGSSRGKDLSDYFCGKCGFNQILNKTNGGYFLIKTDNPQFDYVSCFEDFSELFSKISLCFDFCLIETCTLNFSNLSLFLGLSSEVFLILSDDTTCVQNSYRLLRKIKLYENIKNIKIIMNFHSYPLEIENKAFGIKSVEEIFKTQVIFVFEKYYKHNIFDKISKKKNKKNIAQLFFRSVILNENQSPYIPKKYSGFWGFIRRKIYLKF